MSKRTLVGIGLVSAIGLLTTLSVPSGASTFRWHASAVAGTNHLRVKILKMAPKDGGGEPSLAISKKGIEYVSYPSDKGMSFYRSLDKGKTWTPGGLAQTSSGDTSVNTDSSGAVYESNLNGGENFQDTLQVDVFKSYNRGKTWPLHGKSAIEDSNSSGQPFFIDRQWTAAWRPPGKTTKSAMVCMSYHDFGPGTVWASCSHDGGKTFGAPVDVINDPVAISDSYCNTIPGGTRIVQSGTHAGRIFVAWLAGDPSNPATGCNYTQAESFHDIWVAVSEDKGQTWKDHLVYDAGPLHDASEIFADIALDNAGNPYIAFTMNLTNKQDPSGEFDTWLEASFNGGKTWNGKTDGSGTPYRASCCPGTHYFPSVAAGNPGHVVMAWLHTKFVTQPLPSGKPDFKSQDNANWRLTVAESTNVKSGHPTWTYAEPKIFMHHGNICTLGIACPPALTNRHLLDFIDVQVDPAGHAHVAFTSADAPKKGGLPDAIYVANQIAGPNLGRGGPS